MQRKRGLMIAGLVGLCGIYACRTLLPERYVVNLPLWGFLFGSEPPETELLQARLHVPPGFEIRLFAEGIRNARMLRFTSSGDLLVSSPRESSLFLVEPDRNGDGRSDRVRVLLAGLDRPHGIDFHDDWLYIAEAAAVRRVRFDPASGRTVGALETIVPVLPSGGNHWTRTLRFGPDGWLYVSVGSSCNVCRNDDPRRAALLRYHPDGSGEEIVAGGLRNSVGFDWNPADGELYATDAGRDLLGDDFPPCELNRIVPGGFYGWPFANGNRQPDPDQGKGHANEIARSLPPVHAFVAHSTPLGMTFYRGQVFPERYRQAAFIAQHGSWNRTRKSGYRVVALAWDHAKGTIQESDFVTGFEHDEDVIGRPVDVAEGPEGSLYISDDYGGAVYRVTWQGPRG